MLQLKQRICHKLINTAVVPVTLGVEIAWAIHESLREFVDFTGHYAFRKDGIITIPAPSPPTPPARDYFLADDFSRMIEPTMHFFASDHRTVDYMTDQEFYAFEMTRSQEVGDPRKYIIRNRRDNTGQAQIRLWPTPNVARSIFYTYLSYPLKCYDSGDLENIDVRLPPDCHHPLEWGAISLFGRYLNSNPELGIYVQKWEAFKMRKKEQAPAIGQSHIRVPWTGGGGRGGRPYPYSSAPIGPP